jgi:hypothetical protein
MLSLCIYRGGEGVTLSGGGHSSRELPISTTPAQEVTLFRAARACLQEEGLGATGFVERVTMWREEETGGDVAGCVTHEVDPGAHLRQHTSAYASSIYVGGCVD